MTIEYKLNLKSGGEIIMKYCGPAVSLLDKRDREFLAEMTARFENYGTKNERG